MKQAKRWRVVMDAKKAPAVGDWVAINGLVPGEEERPRFTFLDNSKATGFTVLEGARARGKVPSWQERDAQHASGKVPWLHFPDCMEIVGVERLNWCPETWTTDATLWLLIVESLPSNIEFEKRFIAECERQQKQNSVTQKVKEWWVSAFAGPSRPSRYVATKPGTNLPMIVGRNGEDMWDVWEERAKLRR